MKKIVLSLFISFSSLFCLDFSVATYNVENLFDHNFDGTEYKDFRPNSRYWNQKAYNTKLQNTIDVLKDLDAEIIALQEIENENILKQLAEKLNYPYYTFDKQRRSAIGLGILSKFPIQNTKIHTIPSRQIYRNIIQCDFSIENSSFTIFVNHWNSKRKPESYRIKTAYKLSQILQDFQKFNDYIIVGDLNENYDEYLSFKYDKKLNDTQGITGINHLLNTTVNGNFVQKEDIFSFSDKVHFNPWLELDKNNRFSSKYRQINNTPDHILLSVGLFDNHGISYIENSFSQSKFPYLFKNNKITRWNKYRSNGYSDHLPLVAKFTTNKTQKEFSFKKKVQSINSIRDIYQYKKLDNSIILDDIFVLYKHKKMVILKRKNDRAIRYYGNKYKHLELNHAYKLQINKLDTYNGNLEIKDISILEKGKTDQNIKDLFLDANSISLFDEEYQNEMISKLSGIYKNRKLYYNANKSIYLYFDKSVTIPPDGSTLTINNGLLTKYKSKTQITIFSSKDFSIN